MAATTDDTTAPVRQPAPGAGAPATARHRSHAGLAEGGWRQLPFEFFRPGITVHWLEKTVTDGPSAAILHYEPGARVPRHRHLGLETILVLDGVQSDENGDHSAGTLVLNAEGSEHSVWTDGGCTVLIQWARPVVILEDNA